MVHDDDLSPEDKARLRRLLAIEPRLTEMEKADSNVQWFWSFLGRMLKWLFAVAAGVITLKAAFGDLLGAIIARLK